MVTDHTPKGPYAPAQNVLAVIRRMRERGLPEKVDGTALAAIGIPEGNQPRTLAALKFLQLVNEETELRTAAFNDLGQATTDEYPGALAAVLREAYAAVFEIVDPTKDDEGRIDDAFRRYEPAAQRGRMVTLFLALCAEAGLSAPKAETPPRRSESKSRGASQRSRSQRQPQTQHPPSDGAADLRAVHAVVDQLPSERWWTSARRDRWIRMLEGVVDYVVDLRDEPPPCDRPLDVDEEGDR